MPQLKSHDWESLCPNRIPTMPSKSKQQRSVLDLLWTNQPFNVWFVDVLLKRTERAGKKQWGSSWDWRTEKRASKKNNDFRLGNTALENRKGQVKNRKKKWAKKEARMGIEKRGCYPCFGCFRHRDWGYYWRKIIKWCVATGLSVQEICYVLTISYYVGLLKNDLLKQ